MKSTRGRQVKLELRDAPLIQQRLDNFIYISPENVGVSTVTLQKQGLNALLSTGTGIVSYPAASSSELKKNEIFIPAEIARDFALQINDKVDCVLNDMGFDELIGDALNISFTIQNIDAAWQAREEVSGSEIMSVIRRALALYPRSYPLQSGQVIVLPFRGYKLELRVGHVEGDKAAQVKPRFYRLTEKTNIQLENKIADKFNLQNKAAESVVAAPHQVLLDLAAKGIGGFKNEIRQIVRTTFCPRELDEAEQAEYGIDKHAKGILLYGPPGTGKTIIAKAICEAYTTEPIKIVSGPELKSVYYGGSQQNLADLFIEAKRHPDKLFAFIFDEIDALFVTRGGGDTVSTSNNNDLVNRFLGILDGAATLDNIIVIGTTNRKELLDPAVLRAGRLETHIYIGLPDEKDRLEILQVHTKNMKKKLAADVDLPLIARLAKNYSGAELARVVRLARSYAIMENFTESGDILVRKDESKAPGQTAMVTQQFFMRALQEVAPMFGVDEVVDHGKNATCVYYNDELLATAKSFTQAIKALHRDAQMKQLNYLISGAAGSGKTSLAIQLSMDSGFRHVQMINAAKLLPHPIHRQLEIIDEIILRARQSNEPSVVILDDLEEILETTPDCQQFNNRMRIKLNEILKSADVGNNQVLVIATTNSMGLMQGIGLDVYFAECTNLTELQITCGDERQCGAVLAIAKAHGLSFVDDVTTMEKGNSYLLTIKDLIYQMRKFTANVTHEQGLKLSEFLAALPAKYRSVRQHIGQHEVELASVSLFRKSSLNHM